MELVLQSPQLHSTFGSLGFVHEDQYKINENCNATLETILHNILTEDKYLRTYRRSISFGQNINKDLVPLLIHTNDDATVELLIKILVNLTIPIECLLSVDTISKTDYGRHTIFEINKLLSAAKNAFTDIRATKVIVEFLMNNMVNLEQTLKLPTKQCANICNSLLLLRNILHIPEEYHSSSPTQINNGSSHTVQNQILWNIFSQSIDKALIKLMTISDASKWAVTMVQLVALLYKDQHVVTLHKLLNMWLETSLSDSSEDNESNTSPLDRGRDDSSPMLTSDPTSDSSDTGASGNSNDGPNSENNGWDSTSVNNISENGNQPFQGPVSLKESHKSDQARSLNSPSDISMHSDNGHQDKAPSSNTNCQIGTNDDGESLNVEKRTVYTSDCGYGTQIETQESISTSSNEDDLPSKKPVHQKPHNPKQRVNTKARVGINLQEKKRKKIVKRIKANITNVQGLAQKIPTDGDIANVLKEFTVDFLLKGYNSLVETLHNQILTNMHLEIDTSHFFWLVTYFLKFATQIELDLEHVSSVLSFEMVSYLTAEGVDLCEQFELANKLDGKDLKPSIRRLHLVVTAIREFIQAVEVYKKFAHISNDDKEFLVGLQMKMCATKELRSLLVLLLRHYNPNYHTKQYLQDLIVTNHILLTFLDSVMKLPTYNGSTNMHDHIKQFASPVIMCHYGLLLENYTGNGEFVNDCIFTLMHHVGGELGSLSSLFQPKILKTFTVIWKSEFEICDDWSDLIQYVINMFITKPQSLLNSANFPLVTDNFDVDKSALKEDLAEPRPPPPNKRAGTDGVNVNKTGCSSSHSSRDSWTEEELSSLSWNYVQCSKTTDVVGEIVRMFREDGIIKSRNSVVRELFKLHLVNGKEYESMAKIETDRNIELKRNNELNKICQQLTQDGYSTCLSWVQNVLLDTCSTKIHMQIIAADSQTDDSVNSARMNKFKLLRNKANDLPLLSPVAYHALVRDHSVPLVPWNCEQAKICKNLKFLQLLHKLGFHMPVDTGKIFIRIPQFWTADFLYQVASKIMPIDTSQLNFSVNDLSKSSAPHSDSLVMSSGSGTMEGISVTATDNFYQIQEQEHRTTMVNFTPMPDMSFNSEEGDQSKQNWLEVVKKSQECKIAFNLESNIMKKDVDTQSESRRTTTELLRSPQLVRGLMLPGVMCPKRDPAVDALQLESEGYNHSLCETASVASDLTRMYVSDEDEKEPQLLAAAIPIVDNCTDAPAQKRPRLQFTPIFDKGVYQ